jgi:hypothetical protein
MVYGVRDRGSQGQEWHIGHMTSCERSQEHLDRANWQVLPELEAQKVQVVAVGIGSLEGAREFSRELGFPLEKLYVVSLS